MKIERGITLPPCWPVPLSDCCQYNICQPAAHSQHGVKLGRAGCVTRQRNHMIKGNLQHLSWKTYELMMEAAADPKLANGEGGVPGG